MTSKQKKAAAAFAAITITAIFAVILPFTACGNATEPDPTPNEPVEITREFTLTIFGNKTITLKDERTGNPTQDLAALGIKQKIQDSLDLIDYDSMPTSTKGKFDAVLSRNLVIIVENPANHYDAYKAVDGHTMSFDIDYLNKAATTTESILIDVKVAVRDDIYNIVSKASEMVTVTFPKQHSPLPNKTEGCKS